MKKKRIEKGTLYVNGCNLGPAERDPTTGNIEAGPHIAARHAKAGIKQAPVAVNARMSATEMIAACGFTLRRATAWTYSIYDQANQRLHTSSMTGLKAWLRREKYVL